MAGRAARTARASALGTLYSEAKAAAGGVVWFCVAWYSQYELGYIAWKVGVLAGLGTYLG